MAKWFWTMWKELRHLWYFCALPSTYWNLCSRAVWTEVQAFATDLSVVADAQMALGLLRWTWSSVWVSTQYTGARLSQASTTFPTRTTVSCTLLSNTEGLHFLVRVWTCWRGCKINRKKCVLQHLQWTSLLLECVRRMVQQVASSLPAHS